MNKPANCPLCGNKLLLGKTDPQTVRFYKMGDGKPGKGPVKVETVSSEPFIICSNPGCHCRYDSLEEYERNKHYSYDDYRASLLNYRFLDYLREMLYLRYITDDPEAIEAIEHTLAKIRGREINIVIDSYEQIARGNVAEEVKLSEIEKLLEALNADSGTKGGP